MAFPLSAWRHSTRAVTLAATLALSACAAPPSVCPQGAGRPMLLATLYFGRGAVSDAAWAGFVNRVVVPALPDGFTVLDAAGGWRDPRTGLTGQEGSKLLVVAIEDSPERRAALETVRTTYKHDFHQQSVGMTIAPVCGDF